MKAAQIQRQLDAGGLVSLDAKCDQAATEAIVARSYTAPILGARVVVKLSSDRLVQAEDLAMDYLGMQPRSMSPPLARQHRTALDFAHWALIHQPKQAQYALDLVKRMKGAERKAAAKPGHAWDMYAEMADELNKSVRNFLPAFWEQAARSFKNFGNMTYAGRALNKALEAERVHALQIDREHRRDAVLEFSLSGCLSGKALSDYSKDLADQFPPNEAYDTYRDLLIRRTLGGMAPTGNAGSDLIRLAKAAKHNVDQEVESFLETIISSPAMVRAPMQFWKSVQKQVGNIVKRSQAFGMWLLVHTNPQSRYTDDSQIWAWLDLLDHWQVLPLLWKPAKELPTEVEIPGGRAAWIAKLAVVETSPQRWVFELLEKMAVVLKDEGQPVNLHPAQHWQSWVDVDVLETCLQLEIPVSDETAKCKLEFSGWLREVVDHPRRNSQLSAIAADSRFTNRLIEAMPELVVFKGGASSDRYSYGRTVAARRAFESAVVEHPAVKKFWWAYLDQQLNALEQGGLIQLEESLGNLSKCVGPGTVGEFPQLTQRLAAIDVANNLLRAFQAGVFDEYGWDALDCMADKFPIARSRARHDRKGYAVFPFFSYTGGGELHFVGPTSSKTYPLVLAKGVEVDFLVPIGDDAMLVQHNQSWEKTWRWLSEPESKARKTDQHLGYYSSFQVAQLSDGSWFGGGKAIREGDDFLPSFDANWFSDGTRVWKLDSEANRWGYDRQDNSDSKNRCREIDPQSGKATRESVPPFFEHNLPAGAHVVWGLSKLLPAPPLSGDSPLGSQAGLIGWRVVRRRDGSLEGTGVDGRSTTIPANLQPPSGFLAPVGLMDRPASDGYWLITNSGTIIDQSSKITITNISSDADRYWAGQPVQLEAEFLHLMRVRHEPSSRKLRAVDAITVKQLLDAAAIEHEAKKLKEDPSAPDPKRHAGQAAVEAWLADAPQRLVIGVAKLAYIAAIEGISLVKLAAKCQEMSGADAKAQASAVAKQAVLERANEGLARLDLQRDVPYPLHPSSRSEFDTAEHIRALAKFLAGESLDALPPTELHWFALLIDPVAVAYNAFWRIVTNEELGESVTKRLRTPWLDALRMFSDSGILKINDGLVIYRSSVAYQHPGTTSATQKKSFEDRIEHNSPIAFVEGTSRYVAYRFFSYMGDQVVVIERPSTNKPMPPKGMNVEETTPISKSWSPAQLLAFVDTVEKLEQAPFPDPKDIEEAANELGMQPIAVAIAFMGNLRTKKHGQEKLTSEVRDFYKWKVKDIQVAIAQLDAEKPPANVGCEFARNNPSEALGAKRNMAVRRMVMAWKASQQKTFTIPAELASVIERTSKVYGALSSSRFAEMISDPENANALRPRVAKIEINTSRNAYELFKLRYDPVWVNQPAHFFTHLARAIGITNYVLPSGHELRLQIPKLIKEARRLCDQTNTLLPFGGSYSQFDGYTEVKADEAVAAYSSLVGKLEKDADGVYRGDNGLVTVGLMPPRVMCMFRPAELQTKTELQRLQAVAGITYEFQMAADSTVQAALAVIALRGDGFERLCSWNEQPPVPEGRWDQDPRLSHPKLVEQVGTTLNLSSETATLYLQLLALPDPTMKNVRQWNDWSAKEWTEATDDLIAKELVVQAKRPRAGRDVFLPGGWEALALPNLPIESWKLPLFGYDSIDAFRGYNAELIVCQDTLHALFQRAWERVAAGDPPRYEEAQLQRERKK